MRATWLCLLFGTLAALSPRGGMGAEKETVRRDPQIQAAIDKGAAFLQKNGGNVTGGWESFPALAMVKAGIPHNDPIIVKAVDKIRMKLQYEKYQPVDKNKQVYEAGCDLMLLSEMGAELYQAEMEKIVQYLITNQFSEGYWDYPINGVEPQVHDQGDTSISQYAMLGLWAAERAGIKVPVEVWDKAAAWHAKTQRSDGSFSYHPGGRNDHAPTHSMTAAGTGSLLIAKLHLAKDKKTPKPPPESTASGKSTGKLSSVLEKVDLDNADAPKPGITVNPNYDAKTSVEKLDSSAAQGVAWVGKKFTVDPGGSWRMYYLYALERMAALADVDQIGGQDWYRAGAAFLVKNQTSDGSWQDNAGSSIDTSFALLFLTESTGEILQRRRGVIRIGGGILASGRNLPDNLAEIQMQDGKIKERKLTGPVDELLAALEKPESLLVSQAQTAIVEAVQVGDREALVGQVDRLIKLLGDPRPEVRRTAAWALGRSDDLRTAPRLIAALKDQDPDVMTEAHNSLCALSRKPHGPGIADSPLTGVAEDADEPTRAKAIEAWRKQAIQKWNEWYFSVRPYDERDDIGSQKKPK